MEIFLVEDCNILNKMVTDTFEGAGHKITTFTDGKEALNNISKNFDIYLIDINLPNVNGLELVKQIKLLDIDTKIFIMSSDVNISTIIKAYDLGCDDYIKKPFDVKEILAKVNRTILQSSKIVNLSEDCYFNPVTKILTYKNKEIKSTKKLTALLNILVKNIGNTVSQSQIENHIWGEMIGNSHVRQLVSKLKKLIPCNIIKNHVGNGYRIEKYNK